MADRPPTGLRLRSAIMLSLLASSTIALVVCGCVLIGIEPARQVVLHTGLAFLLGLLLSTAASWWISRALSRPFEQLAQTLRQPGPERLDPVSPALREIRDIASAIRSMGEELASAHDVQRRAQTDLERANRDLAALARQHEAQVTAHTEQWELALHKANEAIRARDALLANTSHEIRTPLYGIIGGVELVRPSLSSADDLRNLDAIMQSAESLTQLINDLLDFSRINAGAL